DRKRAVIRYSAPGTKPLALSPQQLAPRPLRRSLCQKRGDALAKVAARVTQRDQVAIGAGGDAPVGVDAPHHFLGRSQCEGGVRGNSSSGLGEETVGLGGGLEAVHEAKSGRLRRGEKS